MLKRVLSLLLAMTLVLGTGVGMAFAAEPRTVNVGNAAELIAAIRDLQAGDTIVLAAGTYDVERQLGDMTFGGQTGWYLPLWQDGVTIQGAGPAATILTSSTYSANGAWASQDFISVWANGVTIDGVRIESKVDTNKAIEVMGRDFTLKNTDVMTNPAGPESGWDYYEFAGSIYFNPQLSVTGTAGSVGASSLENVFVESAWIAAPTSAVTTGTILLEGVTLDWIEAGYAPYGYGMMSSNPVFEVVSDVLFIVDDTMDDIALQATSRMPEGARLEFYATPDPDAEIPGAVFTALKDGGDTYPADGDLTFSYEETSSADVPYSWTFPIGMLDPSFTTTFYPAVAVRTTVDTPVGDMTAAADLPVNGLHVAELGFAHSGSLPGPAAVTLLLNPALAGLQFDLVKYSAGDLSSTALGDPVERVTVDPSGYATVHIDTGDLWYLVEYRPLEFIRHDGATRFETAADAALADFPDGANTVIIANAWDFPDALAASTLAGVTGAPILLVDAGPLNPTTTDALAKLSPEDIYLVGGPKVISTAIEEVLSEQYAVTRLGGADRYETARLVAEEAVALGADATKAFLVYGGNFADALSVASIAAQERIPVLLTRTDVLHPDAASFIDDGGVTDVYIAGGEKVVAADTADQAEALGAAIVRWAGLDRYETAKAVADGAKAAFGLTFSNIGVASGANFPDALAAGAAIGAQNGLLVLTDPVALSKPTEDVILANKADILKVEFFGGTVALSQDVEDAVRALLQ